MVRSTPRSAVACTVLLAACAQGCSQSDSATSPAYGSNHDAGPGDAASADAVADASPDQTGPVDSGLDAPSDAPLEAEAPQGPALYPSDQTQSPITPWVVARLGEILDRAPSSRRDLFMKAGDSITASGSFLNCFAGSNVNLDSHTALQPTLDLYRNATITSSTPFDRTSLSVESGRTAWWAMTGQPPPLQQEISATNASVAVVMFGTNDIG